MLPNHLPSDSGGILQPLTSQQKRFWFGYQRSKGRDSNCLLRCIRFKQIIDRNFLNIIVHQVFSRHQLLMATICIGGESWPSFNVQRTLSIDILWTEQERVVIPVTPANAPGDIGLGFNLADERPWRLHAVSTPEADYLFFNFHHIICDELSVLIIMQEIDAALSAAGVLSASARFDDFQRCASQLQREQEQQQAEGGVAFWQDTLKGAPALLNLPVEKRKKGDDTSVYRCKESYHGQILQPLQQFLYQQKLTLPVLLASVFTTVLASYSDETDIVLGMPVSLRSDQDMLRAVGPFINILPLRCTFDRSLNFVALCQSIRARLSSALDYSAIPFEDIVRGASQEKVAGRHPLFQATLSCHDLREAGGEFFHEVECWSGSLSCDLSLTCEQQSDRLTFYIDGNKDLFSRAFLDRLMAQVVYGLSVCISQPTMPAGSLTLIPDNQRKHLLNSLSGISRTLAAPAVLPAIQQSALRYANSLAISGSQSLTYSLLMTQALRISQALRQAGVKKDEFILINIAEDAHPVAEIVGTLLCGAAWIPVSVSWPHEQLHHVAGEVKCRFSLGATLPLDNVTPLAMAEIPLPANEVIPPAGMSPMYAISTSGTTGEPKVAVIPWRGIANRFAWMSAMFMAERPVTLKTTPYIYDSSVWQLLWPLTCGGRCVLPDRNQLFDPVALAGLIERENITVIDFVPSVINALLPAFEQSDVLRGQLQGLRWVIIGAENLPVATAKRVKNLLPEAKIINSYGPTEASIGCVYHQLDDLMLDNVPIGEPIPNVQVAVVNTRQQPVPQGALGELLLMGDCVGLGYMGTEDQKGFISVTLSEQLTGRAYRTGDWVRWNEDGQLEFIARMDRQVKLRGVRIELSALESVLESFPGVTGSYSQVIRSEGMRESLVSFVKTPDVLSFGKAELVSYLKNTLVNATLPEHIMIMGSFPLAPSGKIDSKLLVNHFINQQNQSVLKKNKIATQNPVEDIWQRVLQSDGPIDHDLNFFDAGGHSLLMLELLSALNRKFSVQLTVVDLFNYPTITDQLKLIESIPGKLADLAH